MKSLAARSTRVNVQHISQIPSPFYTQDVTVSAYEDVRRIGTNIGSDRTVPAPGMPADVGHPEPKALQLEALVLRRAKPNRSTVDISPYGRNGRKLLELIQDIRRSDVARMQDLINIAQILRYGRMKIAVRIGNDA